MKQICIQLIVAVVALPLSAAALFEGPTNGSGGLPPGLHSVTLAGQPAHIIVGTGYDPLKPTYLAYYLHGDEGGYTYNSSTSSPIRKLIDKHGWIYVAPRAPEAVTVSGIFPWDGSRGGSQQGNAAQVREVLDHMFTHYNVFRHRVLGAGASGGSWFHDAVFFPQNGAQYPSHFNLTCGAAGQRSGYFTYNAARTLSMNPSAVANSELKYTIGTADFLYANATVSAPTYAGLGFSVLTEYLPGVGHCRFNVQQSIADYWRGELNEFEASDISVGVSANPVTGDVSLSWNSKPGVQYTVQRSATDMSAETWLDLNTVRGAPSPASATTWTDSRRLHAAGGRTAYYRVVVAN